MYSILYCTIHLYQSEVTRLSNKINKNVNSSKSPMPKAVKQECRILQKWIFIPKLPQQLLLCFFSKLVH